MKKLCTFDIEVDSSTAFVGVLNNKKYYQLSYSKFIEYLKAQTNTIFVGFNSNDYKGYDLAQLIGFACVSHYRTITIPKKCIPRLKKLKDEPSKYTDVWAIKLALSISENPNLSLNNLSELQICRLINTIYFAYPDGNKQIRIPPETKMGIRPEQYKRMKKKIIDSPAHKNKNYFFDLTDVYKSGSLKFLMSRHLGIEYNQTENKTEKKYNITDLIGSGNLFKLPDSYNHAMAILSAQEYFNIHNPILNGQILVTQFLYNVLGEVNVDDVIKKSINKIRNVDTKFANKLDYLVKNQANIPHTISLKSGNITVPLTRGGIHWGQKQYYLTPEMMSKKNEEGYHYYNIDFGSFYPSVYIANKIFGKSGTRILENIRRDRLKIKKTNKTKADGLKLILNILYGIVGKGGKSLFLTSLCQYLMIELVQLLDEMVNIVEVIDMNTDGIIICVKGELSKSDFYLHSQLDGESFLSYDVKSEYVLEVTELTDFLFYKDYNNYMHSFKTGGAWISDTNINNNANMPKYQKLIEILFGLSKEPLTKDLFRLVFRGDKLEWYKDSNDLSYAYPTFIGADNNDQPTYHCYSYKTLRPEHISNDIDDETMLEICNVIKNNFGKGHVEKHPQVKKIDAILRTQGTYKLIPVKFTKAKGYTGEYTWIDDLDLSTLSSILTTLEFNELIMMAIESKKAKPRYFKSLDDDLFFTIDKDGLKHLQ